MDSNIIFNSSNKVKSIKSLTYLKIQKYSTKIIHKSKSYPKNITYSKNKYK